MTEKRKTEKVTLNSISKSIDDLAIITERGFNRTVSKEEFTEFKGEMTDFKKNTERTLFNLDSHARTTNERLDAIEKVLGPLVQTSSFYQSTLREHERRLSLIEREVGLAKQT